MTPPCTPTCPRHLLDGDAPACGDLGAAEIDALVQGARALDRLCIAPGGTTRVARGLLALAAQLRRAEARAVGPTRAPGYGYDEPGWGEPGKGG